MRGFYWSANSPFIQKFWVGVRRAPRAPGISTVIEDGFINLTLPDGRVHRNANPAFMIYECLTNPVWGMCGPDAQMGASFAAAAAVLRDENFGLFMKWTVSDSIENFVGEILDHIQGVLYLSPSTGKWELTLLRGDYDIASLPRYNTDNAKFSNYARKLPGETVNEIVAKWTNPVTEKEETVTIQDLAGIVSQGGQVVSQDRNYYGVRSPDLILTLAGRDLRSAVTPLATCTMRAFRSAWATTPGKCIVVTIPGENIYEAVMRVQTVDYGDRSNGYVTVALIDDIFALDAPAYVGTAPSGQAPTSIEPNPPALVNVFTLPAYLVANSAEQFTEQPEYPEIVTGILTADANADFLSVEPYTDTTLANGAIVAQSIGTRDRIGAWLTTAALPAEAFTVFNGFPGVLGPGPRLATIVFIGSGDEGEVALVQAINSDGEYTLARGVLDTVPRAWPTGTPMWFLGAQRYIDPALRAPGETVSYRPLMRTSVGLLALANGLDSEVTLTERPYLPLRPANVKVNGQGFGTVALAGAAAVVTWANRNRLVETGQVLAWTAGNVTGEDGQTTTVRVLNSDGTMLHEYAGLTGTTTTVAASDLIGGAAIEVASVTAEGESLQAFVLPLTV